MTKLVTTADFLDAYAEGRIGSHAAIEGIGASGFRGLLDALSACGYHLPRNQGREEEVSQEVLEGLPLVAEAYGLPVPEAFVGR